MGPHTASGSAIKRILNQYYTHLSPGTREADTKRCQMGLIKGDYGRCRSLDHLVLCVECL